MNLSLTLMKPLFSDLLCSFFKRQATDLDVQHQLQPRFDRWRTTNITVLLYGNIKNLDVTRSL